MDRRVGRLNDRFGGQAGSAMRLLGARPAALAVLGSALAGAVGCGDPSVATATWQGTVDTLEGVVMVSNPATPIDAGESTWRLDETLSIGVLEGDPDYQFEAVQDLVVDDSGKIYVLDSGARRISVYDSEGLFLRSFGRQGEGPGEFENPGRLVWMADTLVVWDWRLRRLSYFDREGELLRDERLEVVGGLGKFEPRPDGRLWAQRGPSFWMPPRPELDGIGWLTILDLATQSADTVLRWEAGEMLMVRTENFMTVMPKDFAPHLEWAAAPDGRVYVARGVAYEIEVYSPEGERAATIRREYARYPPSAAERDSAVAGMERRAERYGGGMGDRLRKAFEVADPKRATAELAVSEDGYLWVRVIREDDRLTHSWDIFDPEGRYVSAVTVPATLRIHRITGEAVYGAYRDELDVPYVKRYAIQRPGPGD